MLSTKGSDICVSSTNTVAVYKGLTVAVYNVDKTEVNLTHQDLVELINVCSVFTASVYRVSVQAGRMVQQLLW